MGSSPDRNRSPCIFQAAGQASRHGKSDTAACPPAVPAADPTVCVCLVALVGKLRRGRFLICRYNQGDTIPIVVPNVIQAIVVMRCIHTMTESPFSTCEIWNLRSVSQKLYKCPIFSFGSTTEVQHLNSPAASFAGEASLRQLGKRCNGRRKTGLAQVSWTPEKDAIMLAFLPGS